MTRPWPSSTCFWLWQGWQPLEGAGPGLQLRARRITARPSPVPLHLSTLLELPLQLKDVLPLSEKRNLLPQLMAISNPQPADRPTSVCHPPGLDMGHQSAASYQCGTKEAEQRTHVAPCTRQVHESFLAKLAVLCLPSCDLWTMAPASWALDTSPHHVTARGHHGEP